MDSHSQNSKRIIKNTLFLYARMFVVMGVSLFTAGIVFRTLGEENYGIYGLVAGFVVFFSFINQSLTVSTQRFITYEIGKGTVEDIRKVFSVSVINHVIIGIIILLLAETIGLWFVNNQLNIPPDRLTATKWVFQLSVLTAVAGVLQTPYSALILANEKMSIYAYFSLFDVFFKLAVIYLVQIIVGDKLIVYAILMFVSSLLNIILYRIYCYLQFKAYRFCWVFDRDLMKRMFSFSGWSLFGQSAVMMSRQGVNVLINLFFSLSVNAAMGVSGTVTNAVNGFVSNFQNAFAPQLTKSVASGNFKYTNSLINWTSKLSFFLLLIVGVPVILESDFILKVWLGEVPEHAVAFCQLTLLCMMIDCFSNPLYVVIYAHGKIRNYQILVSSLFLLVFVFTWIFFYLGAVPEVYFLNRLVFATVLSLVIRVAFVSKIPSLRFEYKHYVFSVVFRLLLILGLVIGLAFLVELSMGEISGWIRLLLVTLFTFSMSIFLIYFVGFDKRERLYVSRIVKRRLNYH